MPGKDTNKKKIYIAGCGGMLGDAFYKHFKDDYTLKCTDINVNEAWLDYLDFRDFEAYKNDVCGFGPGYLIHLGAHTDIEFCETNQEACYQTNTASVENATHIANELGIPLVYISTAGIFSGREDCYDDGDPPNPIGAYARSKYLGEKFVAEHAKKYLVARAGWMMGGGPAKDKKFIQKIMRQLKEGTSELFVVHDKAGTPTYTHDFTRTAKELIKNEYWGLYNIACKGHTSRLKVATELLSLTGLTEKVTITPVNSAFFKDTYFVKRPDSECLNTKNLNAKGVNKMRHWKESLKEYVEQYYSDYLH